MIRLYINGTEADLGAGGGDALLLFTYAAGDLDAPAVVQNAYSKEVVLPPTQRNAGLFGSASRPDKIRSSADTFDTLARTPFEIRSEAGEVLESGYCKLERASAADGYTLHLFGGLGDFLYGLMYGADGNKKTLASLTYGNTASVDAGLSFKIDRNIVGAAWTRLLNYAGTNPPASPYDVVNFAPMQNGKPDGFDCGKALVPVGGAHGCPTQTGEAGITMDGTEYALVELGNDLNEWEVRDLRSYLQRPVINIGAVLHALTKSANNGGYTFDWSAIADKWYAEAWMTLPQLAINATQGSKTLTLSWYDDRVNNIVTGEALGPIGFRPTTPTLEKVKVNMNFNLRLYHGVSGHGFEWGWLHYNSFIFLRLIAYDANNNIVAMSPVRCLYDSHASRTPAQAAINLEDLTGYTQDGVTDPVLGSFSFASIEGQELDMMEADDAYVYTDAIALTLEGWGYDHLALAVKGANGTGGTQVISVLLSDDTEYSESLDREQVTEVYAENYTSSNATYEATARVRSGAAITKADLLGGTASPAELLLSFVKTFGLVLKYDGLAKKVTLCERDAFYAAGTNIDLTARIDRSKAQPLTPNGIEAKWLRFAHGDPGGTFAETYASKYGEKYGTQRVNTGSPFNADTLEVLEGVGFRAGVTGLAYGRYYWRVKDASVGTGVLPSAYLDNAAKYTLWNKITGEASQHDVAALTRDAQLLPVTGLSGLSAPGYDAAYRLQAGDGDGSGVLLFYAGYSTEWAHITDDTPAMLNANDGQPCWVPRLTATASLNVPLFLGYRFAMSGNDWTTTINASLDMGRPRELAMPAATYPDGLDIYSRRWKAYISDRYNGDAHRVTARVDLRGFQIGQALFANFYYFDGCWWVLEKVSDWCWNNPAPVECTFVRVLDKTAYTNGQN